LWFKREKAVKFQHKIFFICFIEFGFKWQSLIWVLKTFADFDTKLGTHPGDYAAPPVDGAGATHTLP